MKWLSAFVLVAVVAMVVVSPAARAAGEHDWLVMEGATDEESSPPEEPGAPSEEPGEPSGAPSAAAEESGSPPEGEHPAPEPREPLGILDPVEVSVDFEVPRDRMWPAPHARLVLIETLVICTREGRRLESTEKSPGKGEYRPRLDGCIRFSQDDVGAKLSATYQYTPMRVALLPPVITTDYEDAWPTMLEVLTRDAGARGYVFADPDDVADALVNLRVSGPSEYPKLAEELDAAALVLAGIGASADQVFAGFYSHGQGSISGSAYSTGPDTAIIHGQTNVSATTSAVYKDMMSVTVGLQVFDGRTGDLIGDAYRTDEKRVRFRRFGPTRRDLTRNLTEKVIAAVLDPAT